MRRGRPACGPARRADAENGFDDATGSRDAVWRPGFGRRQSAFPVTQHSRDTPQFYLTAPSPCPYLVGKEERKVFTHLVGERAGELNNILTQGGFRRSQS